MAAAGRFRAEATRKTTKLVRTSFLIRGALPHSAPPTAAAGAIFPGITGVLGPCRSGRRVGCPVVAVVTAVIIWKIADRAAVDTSHSRPNPTAPALPFPCLPLRGRLLCFRGCIFHAGFAKVCVSIPELFSSLFSRSPVVLAVRDQLCDGKRRQAIP
jgi:hypothetical protein